MPASAKKNTPAVAMPTQANQPGRNGFGSSVRLITRVWKQLKPKAKFMIFVAIVSSAKGVLVESKIRPSAM